MSEQLPQPGMSYEQGIVSVAQQEYVRAEAKLDKLQAEADRHLMSGQPIPNELKKQLEEVEKEFRRATEEWLDTTQEAKL